MPKTSGKGQQSSQFTSDGVGSKNNGRNLSVRISEDAIDILDLFAVEGLINKPEWVRDAIYEKMCRESLLDRDTIKRFYSLGRFSPALCDWLQRNGFLD